MPRAKNPHSPRALPSFTGPAFGPRLSAATHLAQTLQQHHAFERPLP
jgi:hypothetical protein